MGKDGKYHGIAWKPSAKGPSTQLEGPIALTVPGSWWQEAEEGGGNCRYQQTSWCQLGGKKLKREGAIADITGIYPDKSTTLIFSDSRREPDNNIR